MRLPIVRQTTQARFLIAALLNFILILLPLALLQEKGAGECLKRIRKKGVRIPF
jgi:hypothetical protein